MRNYECPNCRYQAAYQEANPLVSVEPVCPKCFETMKKNDSDSQ